MTTKQFSLYIVLCSDDTYYTGIAVDVSKRMIEHSSGSRGAKYLRGRGPIRLVYSEIVGDRATALRIEYRIKQLSRAQKEALVDGRESLQRLANQVSAAG
jgi:putative endonuclease